MSNCEEQLRLFPKPDDERKRKSPDGMTTSNLICTAHVGTNEELFPQILDLHVPPGAIVSHMARAFFGNTFQKTSIRYWQRI